MITATNTAAEQRCSRCYLHLRTVSGLGFLRLSECRSLIISCRISKNSENPHKADLTAC